MPYLLSRERNPGVLDNLSELLGVGVMPLPLSDRQTLGNDCHQGSDVPLEPLVLLNYVMVFRSIAHGAIIHAVAAGCNKGLDICQGMQYNELAVKSKAARKEETMCDLSRDMLEVMITPLWSPVERPDSPVEEPSDVPELVPVAEE